MHCVLVSYIELPKHGVGRRERVYMSDTAMAIKFMLPGGQPVHLSWLWMTFTCANGTDNRWIGEKQLARQPPCYWMVLPVVATEHFPPLIEQFLGKFYIFEWVPAEVVPLPLDWHIYSMCGEPKQLAMSPSTVSRVWGRYQCPGRRWKGSNPAARPLSAL